MFKGLLQRFRRPGGIHLAALHIDFTATDQVATSISWYRSTNQDQDTVVLTLWFYARILYELAELNEVRVARELIAYLEQLSDRILTNAGPPNRPRLRLGNLTVLPELPNPPVRSYRAEFYQLQDDKYRLEFQGSIGKEGFYLPGAFLVFLRHCLENLSDAALIKLGKGIGRLHSYYRYRRDFWEGASLSGGPLFALSSEEISSQQLGEGEV
jgi:hypothetical protein